MSRTRTAAQAPASLRYREIELWLRKLALEGSAGDPIPAEAKLAEQFGVSRMTARQAVQNLAREGLVQRRRGAGTFIAPRPLHRHEGYLLSFTDDMQRRGLEPSSRLLDAGLRTPTSEDASALRLKMPTRVVVIRRIRIGGKEPIALERAALPGHCAAALAEDLEHGSLHVALRNMGRTPGIARSWISARNATRNESDLLELPSRAALLVERRIILDQVGEPLEHTETAYAAERYVIDALFTIGGSMASRPLMAAPTAPE